MAPNKKYEMPICVKFCIWYKLNKKQAANKQTEAPIVLMHLLQERWNYIEYLQWAFCGNMKLE